MSPNEIAGKDTSKETTASSLRARKTKRVTIEMDPKIHTRLRHASVVSDRTLREIMTEAAEDWLAKKDM